MLERTQLMIDKETLQDLRRVAAHENRSMSDVARRILKANLLHPKAKKKDGGTKFLLWLVKNAGKGPGDSEYDKYAY